MQTGAATAENSMEFPQKTKNGAVFWPNKSTAGINHKNTETPTQKNLCKKTMFIVAQFTIAKCWKQPKCLFGNEWIKICGIPCSRKKEGAPSLYNSMDGSGEHYVKWNKPGSEKQIPYDFTYKQNLINKTNKQAKYNQRHWNKEYTDSNQRSGRRGIMRERKGRVLKEYV